jgi:lipopolysaccharide export LptBFGC system permease protein LptF
MWADRGWYQDGAWFFTNVQERVFSSAAFPEMNSTNFHRASFTETPEEIESEIKISAIKSNDFRDMNRAQLSIREILNYKNLHAETISPMLETKLHARLAAPLTCLVVVLIALPFGAATGRRNVFVGVASSIVICFAYFVLMQLAVAIGTNGSVPPWIAAWSPNLLFGLVGIGLTWRVR